MVVKLNRIITKTGDKGETTLCHGVRVSKHDIRIQALGLLDNLNAHIGFSITFIEDDAIRTLLHDIQNDLLDIGADLCSKTFKISSKQTIYLEKKAEHYNSFLKPLDSFILPGGTKGASVLHLSRTATRQAETMIVAIENVNPEVLCYINRLSDLLFILARYVNDCGDKDILWKPGKNDI